MVTDIKSILEEFHYEPVNGILKLGIANGWDEATRYFMEAIRPFRVGTFQTRELGRCYNEYTFTVKDSEMEFDIVYSVDSGD
jgi:hypothetical protein